MNGRTCIRRPIMTVLLNAACIVAGVLALFKIPIAALPQYDTPVIQVSANLPGASPETMASGRHGAGAAVLHHRLGVGDELRRSSLGQTQVTLEFRPGPQYRCGSRGCASRAPSRPARIAGGDDHAAIVPEGQPGRSTNHVFDAALGRHAVVAIEQLCGQPDRADALHPPGIAQVDINGQKKYAVRIRIDPEAAAARGLTLEEVAQAVRTPMPIRPSAPRARASNW